MVHSKLGTFFDFALVMIITGIGVWEYGDSPHSLFPLLMVIYLEIANNGRK